MVARKIRIGLIILLVMFLSLACSAVSTTAAEPTEAASGYCPPLPAPSLTRSGIISDVVMARNTEGEEKNPVNLTTVFGTKDILHAVAKVEGAQDPTRLSATWYATDVGPDIACNSIIDSIEISTFGTRNLDFTLTPESSWPVGLYRVEVSVNGVLDTVKEFRVQ